MIAVELTTKTLVDALPSKVAAVAPIKFVPRIVTLVPPSVVPVAGATLVTVGDAA